MNSKKVILITVIVLSLFAEVFYYNDCSSSDVNCAWSSILKSPFNNKVVEDSCGISSNDLVLEWSSRPKIDSSNYSLRIIASDDQITVCSVQYEKIIVFDHKGNIKWDFITNSSIFNAIIDNDNIYVGYCSDDMDNGGCVCLNKDDGELIWSFYDKDLSINTEIICVWNNNLFVVDHLAGIIFSVNKYSGKAQWNRVFDDPIFGGIVCFNDKLFFSTTYFKQVKGINNPTLYCISADDGDILWEYSENKQNLNGGLFTYSDNNLIFRGISTESGRYSTLLNIETSKGNFNWKSIDSDAHYKDILINNGYIYGINNTNLENINILTGEVLTSKNIDNIMPPLILSNNKLFSLASDGNILIIDKDNFNNVKYISFPLRDKNTGLNISKMIMANKRLYIVDSNTLYCFKDAKQEDDDKPMSVSPTSISFGTVDRGKTSIKEVQLTFNTNEVIKGTITSDKRWFSVTPTTFDSRKSPITISCMIEASKLPGKSGPQTAKVQIKMDSGQTREIDVPIVVETQETIDLELQIGRKFGMIGDLRVDLDSPPFIRGGRTLVPVRFISESFGCSLQWEASQKMITIKRFDEVVLLWIGRNYVTVNGRRVDIDTPPVNENGRTYVPIRVISEAFNAMIVWDDTERKLECSYKPPDDGY